MQDDKYFIPYLTAKSKYVAVKTWAAKCNNQQGGLTFKSGLYAIFYNKTELDNHLKVNNSTREKSKIGVPVKGKTAFPSVDNLRKIIGVNGWFVKDGSNTAERVNSPSAIFNFLKFIGTDKIYDKIASLYNSRHKKSITGADIKKKISSHPVSESKLSTQLKFANDKNDVVALQLIADEINKNTNSKINAVFLIDISRFSKNEMIKDVVLNDISDDIHPINPNAIRQLIDVSNATDQKKLQSGLVVANNDMDTYSAQSGGFFQCIIDENILTGGDKKQIANEFLSIFLLIIDFLDALDQGNLQVSTANGRTVNVSNVGNVLIGTPVKKRKVSSHGGGILSDDNEAPKLLSKILTSRQLDEIFTNKQLGGYKKNINKINDEPNVVVYDEVA